MLLWRVFGNDDPIILGNSCTVSKFFDLVRVALWESTFLSLSLCSKCVCNVPFIWGVQNIEWIQNRFSFSPFQCDGMNKKEKKLKSQFVLKINKANVPISVTCGSKAPFSIWILINHESNQAPVALCFCSTLSLVGLTHWGLMFYFPSGLTVWHQQPWERKDGWSLRLWSGPMAPVLDGIIEGCMYWFARLL